MEEVRIIRLLRACMAQFRLYELHHASKQPATAAEAADSANKALVNHRFAGWIRYELARMGAETPQDIREIRAENVQVIIDELATTHARTALEGMKPPEGWDVLFPPKPVANSQRIPLRNSNELREAMTKALDAHLKGHTVVVHKPSLRERRDRVLRVTITRPPLQAQREEP